MSDDDLLEGMDLELDTFSLTFAHESLDRDLARCEPEAARRLLVDQVIQVSQAVDRSIATYRSERSRIRQKRAERLERAWKGPDARRLLSELQQGGGHFRTFVGFGKLEKQVFQRYEESHNLEDFLSRLVEDQAWWRSRSPLFGEKRAGEIQQIALRIQWEVQHLFEEADQKLEATFGPQVEKAQKQLAERLASRVSWLGVLFERSASVSVDLEKELRERFDTLMEAKLLENAESEETLEGLAVVLPAFEAAGPGVVLDASQGEVDPLILEGRYVELLATLALRRDRSAELARSWRFDDGLRARLRRTVEGLGKENEYLMKTLQPLVDRSGTAQAWLSSSSGVSEPVGRWAERLLGKMEPFRCLGGRIARAKEMEGRVGEVYASSFADDSGF